MKFLQTLALILLTGALGKLSSEAQVKFTPGQPGGAIPGQPGSFAPGQMRPGMPGAAPMLNFVPSMMIEMRPGEKRPLVLKENERNPYARRAAYRKTESGQGENVEEIQIRQQLSQLEVTGRSYGPNGLRLLLGDIIIEKGVVVPQLIPDQTEHLQVIRVTKENVLMGWLDIETRELTGKTVQISYDLSPSVAYALHGQGEMDDEGPARRLMGVIHPNDMQMKQVEGMASNRPDEEAEED